MGGVGMLRPNFLQTASEGVEKSTLSNKASSATSKQPGNAPSESINVIPVVVVGSTSEAKSSETVDGAFESGADEDEDEDADDEDDEFSSRCSPSTMISSGEDLEEEEVKSFTSTKASVDSANGNWFSSAL